MKLLFTIVLPKYQGAQNIVNVYLQENGLLFLDLQTKDGVLITSTPDVKAEELVKSVETWEVW